MQVKKYFDKLICDKLVSIMIHSLEKYDLFIFQID